MAERMYSVPMENSAKPGESAIFRSPEAKDGFVNLQEWDFEGMWEVMCASAALYGDKPCLGTRVKLPDNTLGEYRWKSYNEVVENARNDGAGLLHLNLCNEIEYGSNTLRFLGVCSKNRAEWTTIDIGCSAYDITNVPLYDTLGEEAMVHILEETELDTIATDSTCTSTFLSLGNVPSTMKNIICFDEITDEQMEKAGDKFRLIPYAELSKAGRNNPRDVIDARAESITLICYTSGTTGKPKGVILTNECIKATMAGSVVRPDMFRVLQSDCHISYLPMAHVYERMGQYYFLHKGARVGFYSGDHLKLSDDMQVLKPTIFLSVPRVFEKMNTRIHDTLEKKGCLAQRLFRYGLNTKLNKFANGKGLTHPVFDNLIFYKFAEMLGGNVRIMSCGSAPLKKEIQEHFSVMFSCNLLEGWGMTETCALSFIQGTEEYIKGFVGGLGASLEFKIVSVPDMNYHATGSLIQGEMHVRGPSLFKGYYKNKAETDAAFDGEGWFRTGDIVELSHKGGIKIIDRKKNIYKLSQGEYVSPEKIEGIYSQAKLIDQIFVHGYSTESYLVGIVTPNLNNALEWAAGKSKKHTTLEQFCSDPDLKAEILSEMVKLGNSKLKGFEKIRHIHLTPMSCTIENQLLTSTFKVVRHKASKYFEADILRLYGS